MGFLLLDVSVKIEIIDCLPIRIKQKDCVQPSLPFHKNNPWSMLWPGG